MAQILLRRSQLPARFLCSTVGLAVLAVMTALYLYAPTVYFNIMGGWILTPFPHPFIDWEWLPTAAACWHKGINVYVDNTCYEPVAHGRHSYSPLWLRATFLPLGLNWVILVGLTLAVLFLLSLSLLPPPKRRSDQIIMLLTVLSSMTVFGIELGNIDLLIFLLAMLGVHLWVGGVRSRLAAYAIFTFAGLLKFYPFVLMILVLRERFRVFAAVSIAFVVTVLIFVLTYRDELRAASGNIPTGSYFSVLFGAANLPAGLGQLASELGKHLGDGDANQIALIDRTVRILMTGFLAASAAALALWLSVRAGVTRAMADLPTRDAGFLVVGAALICGCFFAGQSVGYRGIFLLFSLPGLLTLSRSLPGHQGRAAVTTACLAIVFVMWVLKIQFMLVTAGLSESFVSIDSPARFVEWLLHELAWWWIIGVLLSVLGSFAFAHSRLLRKAPLSRLRLIGHHSIS